MSKRKMLFAVLVLLILFVGWIAWDTSPAMEKHNIPKPITPILLLEI